MRQIELYCLCGRTKTVQVDDGVRFRSREIRCGNCHYGPKDKCANCGCKEKLNIIEMMNKQYTICQPCFVSISKELNRSRKWNSQRDN